MAQIKRPAGNRVARFMAAIFVSKQLRWRRLKPPTNLSNIFHRSLNIFAITALSLNIMAAGFPALIAQYNDAQARIPHALAANENLSAPPAADAGSSGDKAVNLPGSLKDQLADQLKKERDGKPRDTRHVQALEEGRTEHDRTYLNADGTKSLVRSMQATSFKDKEGKWQDIDSTLIEDKTTGKWHNKANSWQVIFGDITDDGIQVEKDGQTFAFKPVDAKNVKPIITGNAPDQTVTYRNVWQGIDLQYQVSGSQIKESILIKSRAAQASFDFDAIGANLKSNPDRPGSFLLDGAFKDFSIAPAFVVSADGSSVDGSNVAQTADGNNIHVSLDAGWLKGQDSNAFPVIVDPTLTYGLAAPADYYNFSSTGTSCHGSVACGGQAMGNQGGATNWRFAYKSDLTSIPLSPQQFPLAASLHLELKSGTTSSQTISVDHSTCQTGFACYDTAWGTSTGSVASIADIDVTNVYMGAMWTGVNQPWFMVHGNEATGSNSYKFFDDTKTTITIIYEALPTQAARVDPSPADTGVAITKQPTFFSSTSTDPDGDNPVLYRFVIGTSKSVPAYNPYNLISSVGGGFVESGPIASTQWTVPDNVLQDGTTYYWQVSVRDSLANTPEEYSPAYSFKVDLRNGKDATQAFDAMGPVNVDLASGNLTTSTQTHANTALGGSLGVSLDYNSPQLSRKGLVGSYWNDPGGTHTFPGSGVAPTYQRIDPSVDFNWGAGGPNTGVINQDNFLVRWAGYFVAPQNDTYQFGTTSDDGSRIKLTSDCSGTPYLDQWGSLPNNVFGGNVTLVAGQIQPICYEYYEATGSAQAHLLVKNISGSINKPIDTAWLQTGVRPVATPRGLIGRYYTDPGTHAFPAQDDPARLFLTRTDTSLTQNWGTGSPVPGGPNTGFMVRWTGSYTPAVTGTYNFKAAVSDGVRVTVGSTTVIDSWTDHEPAATVGPTNSVSLTGGAPVSITVDYYQNTGTDQISLLVNRPDYGSGVYLPIETSSLSPQAQVLPDGWALGTDATGNLGYDYAYINLNSVTLRDSTGQTHEYKYVAGSFTPPAGEAGRMVRNGDGTITFQDTDGRTYVFNLNGTLKSSTTPVDDRNPAALQYVYGSSPSRLIQISDAVTQTNPNDATTATRWAKILYAGDANCPSVPSGYLAYNNSSVNGLICAVYSSDGTQTLPVNLANGNVTRFLYVTVTHPDSTTAPGLARIERPGGEIVEYGYDALGRISSIRDALANDAVNATPQVRAPDGTELTSITYDALGHAGAVTLPAATAGASRLSHTYNYYQGFSYMHVAGATEPNGFTRKVIYDSTLRTTDDIDVANLDTQTQWDPAKDMVLSMTDPAGLRSTKLYDYADRPTDQYGPAPAAWFGADRKPLTTPTDYTSQVPHTQTGYDEPTVTGNSILQNLAVAYYGVDSFTNGTGQPTKALFGAPKLHATGVGAANGDVVKNWGATPPFTPDAGKGWGARLSGWIHFTAAGNHTFKVKSDDGARLFVDDQQVINDWADGAYRDHPTYAYSNTCNPADCWKRIQLDYYNKAGDTDAHLELFMTAPGGSETSALGARFRPDYGLATTQKTFDSSTSVGDSVTTTSYGANPELGLAQSSTVDPTGLALTTNNTYETQGATGSFLRQTAKYLPGANPATASTATQYAYYTATNTKDNPCTTGTTEAYKQAGRLKLTTEPDPDGAGAQTPITTETIYDDAGRVVATRFNAETSWKCTTYDARGRVTQQTTPAQPDTTHVTRSARTVTNNWAVGNNPLITSTADDQGTITTTVDLLGRITNYTDAKGNATTYSYDTLGRLISKASPTGTESYDYNNFNRLTAQKLNAITLASPSYDAFGRLSSVAYPTATIASPTNTLSLTIGRDNLGRTNSYDYSTVDPYTAAVKHIIDSTTLSQSGQVISGTEAGAAKTYTYDKADRLTAATLGIHAFSYSFGAPTTCTGTYNSNSGKSANHTSQTIDGKTTTFCYDYADRQTSDAYNGYSFPDPWQYDAHGNVSYRGYDGSGNVGSLEYDSSDRIAYIEGGASSVKRDAQDRIVLLEDAWWNEFGYTGPSDQPDFTRGNTHYVQEVYLQLPGGVKLTNDVNTNMAVTSQIFSLPNIHGDTMATVAENSALTGGSPYPNYGTYQYTPFGRLLTSNKPDNLHGASLAGLGQFGRITETGDTNKLMFMGARLYDPTFGRFTQVDPVEGGTENNYAYPANPVNNTDLNGEWLETAYDIGSFAYSANEFRKHKTWGNFGWAAYDGASVFLPIIPGSLAFRGGSKAVEAAKSARAAKLFREKLALDSVRANPKIGQRIMEGKIKDPRYPASAGWQKMQYVHKDLNGKNQIVVHYFYNTRTGKTSQVKIK